MEDFNQDYSMTSNYYCYGMNYPNSVSSHFILWYSWILWVRELGRAQLRDMVSLPCALMSGGFSLWNSNSSKLRSKWFWALTPGVMRFAQLGLFTRAPPTCDLLLDSGVFTEWWPDSEEEISEAVGCGGGGGGSGNPDNESCRLWKLLGLPTQASQVRSLTSFRLKCMYFKLKCFIVE